MSNKVWTKKELEVLHSNRSNEQKLKLLPGRTRRGMVSRAEKDGLILCRTGSAGCQKWSEEELSVAKSNLPFEEKIRLLPTRTPGAVRLRGGGTGRRRGRPFKCWTDEELLILQMDVSIAQKMELLPGRGRARIAAHLAPTRVPTWSDADLALLALGLDATTTAKMLSRKFSVWSISNKRRKLGLPRKRGRRAFQPEDYPQVDWSKSINQVAKELNVAFYTARTLKIKALGK